MPDTGTDRTELFSDGEPALKFTDPELVEIFDNFAFGESAAHSRLAPRDRVMVQLAALIASGALTVYRTMLSTGLNMGVTPVEVKEIVYQAVPYVGMGRALDFVNTTNEVLAGRGVDLPLPAQSTTTPETRAEQGRAVQEQIVGTERVAALYANAAEDELHLFQFLSANCFGDHLSRSGIGIKTRELLTFALLTALGGADAQIRGHVTANLHVGNTRQQLLDVITVLVPFVGYPRSLNALAAVNDVTGT